MALRKLCNQMQCFSGNRCACHSQSILATRGIGPVRHELKQDVSKRSSCMQDYRVHIKHTDGHFEYIPYFCLPANKLNDVIAPSCYSCFDYPNAVADLVVGYMGVPWQGVNMTEHQQVVTVCSLVSVASVCCSCVPALQCSSFAFGHHFRRSRLIALHFGHFCA